MTTIETANISWYLIRSTMAKMIVNYAMNVLNKTLDTTKTCVFSDMADQTQEMQTYALQACQLWLMGIGSTTFMPNTVVTRAQLWSVLSRMFYTTPESWTPYYVIHLNLLKEKWVITDTNPNLIEIRWYIFDYCFFRLLFFSIPIFCKLGSKLCNESRIEKNNSDFSIFVQRCSR
jgi:3-methyladenine DNA glycosylase AlkD